MQRSFSLAYGRTSMPLTLPEGLDVQVVLPGAAQGLADGQAAVRQALSAPVGTPPLLQMLLERRPKKIVVVVNDETRPTPYNALFPPLLEVFAQAGIADEQIVFLIATGIHAPHTPELNERIYGREMTRRFRFINHDARDAQSLVNLGRVQSGYEFLVNRLAVECDFLITIGVVMPHYFAGFSGGRKSILPGLAGHKTVAQNHARMVELLDALPPVRQNPVSLEMIDAARKVGVDFILNTVSNERNEIVSVLAGDLEQAWYAAVDISAGIYETPFREQVDISIVCASGYPRDVNCYQAQKALDHADHITRSGGTIIWVAECPGGFGEGVFEQWLRLDLEPAEIMRRIRENFVLGAHKAYAIARVAAEKDIVLVSSMSEEDTRLLFARKAINLDEAVREALARHGQSARVAVMPQGSLTLPVQRA